MSLPGLMSRKAQELMSYLLLFRSKPHRREALADLLWGGTTTAQSKKYLRQALWQLQAVLDHSSICSELGPVLLVDGDWIQVNDQAKVWLDVAEVEAAFEAGRGIRSHELSPEIATVLTDAVELYHGELLEGWYQDWCVFERERLKAIYLSMVEKLLGYHEAPLRFDECLHYGEKILRHDRAHERTHYRLMRLRHLMGDRTGAMRQYDLCAAALRDELEIAPSEGTWSLYECIRADKSPDIGFSSLRDRPDGRPEAVLQGTGDAAPEAGECPAWPEQRPETERHDDAAQSFRQALTKLRQVTGLVEQGLHALQTD